MLFFGFGIGAIISHYAADLTVSDIQTLPWGGLISVLLVIVGGYLAFWPSKKPTKETLEDQFSLLWVSADNFINRVRYQRNLGWHERRGSFNRAEDTRDIARDGISLLMQFEQAGIPAPKFNEIQMAEQIAIGCEAYLAQLAPFMRDGHTAQVLTMADATVNRAEQEARSFDPQGWLSRDD